MPTPRSHAPPAATPAAALKPRLACAAASDLTELPPHLSEESSLEPALVLAREKELLLENAPGPILDLIILQSTLSFPQEVVLPPLFDLFLFYLIVMFFLSQGYA